MKKQFLFTLIFLFVSVCFADNKVFTETSAQPDANRVVINWITKDETNVKYFIIKRSNDDKNFIELDRVNSKGPGYKYEYIDEDVFFKSSGALFYRIDAINGDNKSEAISESMMVHPNLTGIFQTWGAIKAMFR